jgi:hypothetical protein
MSWSWQYQATDGSVVTSAQGTAETFPSQSDAETWLGEVWRDLLAEGVAQVVLLEDGRVVYGPMSLHPPS